MSEASHDSATAIDRAIAQVGSQSALARALGISQNAVSRWQRGVNPVPAEQVIPIEEATGISRHDLRPDIYPLELTTPAGSGELGAMEPAR